MGYCIWRHDNERTRDLFLDGAEVVVRGSDYLGNDFLIEAFMDLGFWDIVRSPEPKLGRSDVAVDPMALNAIWAIKELAGLGRVSEADKVLSDGRLMATAGMNVERVREHAFVGAPVVSRRTLYRHAERMDRKESARMLLRSTTLARERKWLRGRVFAADCYEIPVTGKKMEGIYENTDKTTRRGYKLLTVSNVTPDREQIVAAALGGICQDERVLLGQALDSLASVADPAEMIGLLLLDRGFWSAPVLYDLAHVRKIPFLTLAKDDLDLVVEVERRVREEGEVRWEDVYLPTRDGPRRHYRARAVEEVFLDGHAPQGKSAGSVNCVLAYADSPPGEPPKRIIFVTSGPVRGREVTVMKRYKQRWSIENECMKWLSEHDGRKINGWTLNAVQYRLFLLLVLRNAMTLVDWKYPSDAARMRRTLAQRKRRAYLAGHGVIIYTQKGVFGTYPSDEGMAMAEERGARRVLGQLGKEVVQGQLPGFDARRPTVARLDDVAIPKLSR